jgi:hypothetical protein
MFGAFVNASMTYQLLGMPRHAQDFTPIRFRIEKERFVKLFVDGVTLSLFV